ncbi:hypothetical protein HYPBUDRAFT_222298 [Hyphopichia burtonii NRRL Y-1933]|uniref:Uncharacterized protein n=1 Tax=Hyphopichia burtonii NRRL Y-1933 TaxID=984485 RepID=A0A1E4RFR5_9ASCO|nr:hypothetical protein HYPBUDRAFT_222298 [Hyphopichia burtonii NRRL Y-1933]ODV66093.1 hypothetical protein HYPBUDRAFT_222298 [Hyphopichia burtonii NRRL Y-1933]
MEWIMVMYGSGDGAACLGWESHDANRLTLSTPTTSPSATLHSPSAQPVIGNLYIIHVWGSWCFPDSLIVLILLQSLTGLRTKTNTPKKASLKKLPRRIR